MTQVATAASLSTVPQIHRDSIVIDGRDPTFLVDRQMSTSKPDYWDALAEAG